MRRLLLILRTSREWISNAPSWTWVFFVIGLLSILWYGTHSATARREAAATFFAHALQSAQIDETVSMDGVEYRIEGATVTTSASSSPITLMHRSRALALAYEKALARRAPLFHSAGADLGAFDVAISSLESSATTFASLQDSTEEKERVGTLFPIRFLRAYADLERARRAFIASGSDHDSIAYRAAFSRTIDEFHDALGTFEKNFEASVPASRKPFVSGTKIIERPTVLASIPLLLRSTSETEHLFDMRIRCIGGNIAACSTQDLAVPRLSLRESSYDFAQAIAAQRSVDRARSAIGLRPSTEFKTLALNKSSCVLPGWDVPPFFAFSLRSEDFHAVRYYRPNLISDLFLLRDRSDEEIPFFEAFDERGLRYIPVAPLAYYKCMELDADLGALYALRAVSELATGTPLSGQATGELRTELVALEEALSAPIVREYDAAAYLTAARPLIEIAGTSSTTKDTIIDLTLAMRDRSAGTAATALDAAYLSELTLALRTEGIPTDLSSAYLFSARSGFPAFYQTHNQSATPGYRSPLRLNSVPREKQPYVLLSELAPLFASDLRLLKQVAHDIRVWKSLHWNPQ